MAYRMSTYSNASAAPRTNTMQQQSAQVSTTTLLNALHGAYTSGTSYPLESSTSVVVNTWLTASSAGQDGRYGGTVDVELARRAWEHARRRAEDGCIILGTLHRSTPSVFAAFVSALPISLPGTFYTALNALRPFLHCVTPYNPSLPRYSALVGIFSLNLAGEINNAALSLSTSGIDTKAGLLEVPAEAGYRAFDVFYYLLESQSAQEREYLGLKPANKYTLLRKSETYKPPTYLPTADDAASAEDFRESLKAIGIKGKSLRSLLAVIAAILRLGDGLGFLVDEVELEATCEEVSDLLELDSEVLMRKCATEDREVLIAALYEAVVDWVIGHANEAIRNEIRTGNALGSASGSDAGANTPPSSHEDEDSVSITVVDIPAQALGKATSLKTVFDDSTGINLEMKEDGVPVIPAGSSVIREMKEAIAQCEPELDIMTGPLGREHEAFLDRREAVLEKVGFEADEESFLRKILYPVSGQGIMLGKHARTSLTSILASSRVWFQLCLHPSDDSPANFANLPPQNSPWSAGSVSSQIRSWRLPEWANHRNKQLDFTADFDYHEFYQRYSPLGCMEGRDGVEAWITERGWSNGEVVLGSERIWIREAAWWEVESMIDMKPVEEMPLGDTTLLGGMMGGPAMQSAYSLNTPLGMEGDYFDGSKDNLLADDRQSRNMAPSRLGARSLAPTLAQTVRSAAPGDYGLGSKGDDKRNYITYDGELDGEFADGKSVVVEKTSLGRRLWVALVWALTFWIPSPVLKWVGRMKRPDVRMAWREKLVLVFLIFLLNGLVVFYIIEFGRLLCPDFDKAWNLKEVGYHTGDNDYYVAFRGGVYDLSKFWRTQHSDTSIQTDAQNMQPFAGTDVSGYIAPLLYQACPPYVSQANNFQLIPNTTLEYPNAEHTSGNLSAYTQSALHNEDWYGSTFLPKMDTFKKGKLVWDVNDIKTQGENDQRPWFIINDKVYDLTDYFNTLKLMNNLDSYKIFPDDVASIVQGNPGLDITETWANSLNQSTAVNSLNCLNNRFFIGYTDFRKTPRCEVQNYILLAFTCIICAVIGIKFLAALQLGSKKRPAQQDKFVICQVPAYTEGEDSLRKGLDSLTALAYDNKRKLICVICDGMIVGGGNDRPTPKIVLDILGVDPKTDPPALPFKSIGIGSEQLNYGKVYSGLYEYEGNVVPYVVVVKVGKETEQAKSKPGNRGKRDSQVMLMSFLNRVHHRSPMNPLELEMFHQINNIIGVDPELYEYLFMVDADTKVKEDSLNRLVAACANDATIAGICGETSLENEEGSWWTMIQVYEYYISHNLAKAFESLFGSVTCLPGCFTMYRLRTADKGRPLIIADKMIAAYADNKIDTLHKKNLLSLGEDRYLTTLMIKYFPQMSYKYLADAYALTEAPATWSVLLSQRRRWINSTIHNLAEMMWIDHCGFCFFSMRFVVILDLFGTLILPATLAYVVYLIYVVASKTGPLPLVSLIMIAAVYGLQAIIFIVKRQWQHIGWMVIYIMAYPIWSLILPVYSFWKQDDFSWGNTRIVIGEKGDKQLVAVDDEGFDPRSIPLQRWDDYATANGLPGRRGMPAEKEEFYADAPGYEMDDMHSVYSSVKPASTILTGFPQAQTFRPPASPGPFNAMNPRHSTFSHMSRYTDHPVGLSMDPMQHNRVMSTSNLSDLHGMTPGARSRSQDNLLTGMQTPPLGRGNSYSPQGGTTPRASVLYNRSSSAVNLNASASGALPGFQTQGPTNEAITLAIRECLAEVDLDSVTKKQLKALAEQKLQCQLTPDKRAFLDLQIDSELANM